MFAPNVHQKFKSNNLKGAFYFNKDHTYRIIYAFSGCLSERQVRASICDALGQLAEKFPHMKNKIKKCNVIVNMPYRSSLNNKGEIEYHYMDIANIFVSDWEIGNAICGFNFDGSMRIKIAPVSAEDMPLEKLIEEKYPEGDQMTDEEWLDTKKKLNRSINTISSSNIENNKSILNSSVRSIKSIKFVIESLIKDIANGNREYNFYGQLFKPLIDEEMATRIKNSEGDEILRSLVYRLIVENISVYVNNSEKLKVYGKKIYQLIGFLFSEGTLYKEDFLIFVSKLTNSILNPESESQQILDLENFTSVIMNSGKFFEKHMKEEFEQIKDVVENMDNPRIKTIFADALENCKEIEEPEYSYSKQFKICMMEPLCFLPAIELTGKAFDYLKKYVDDVKYEECKDSFMYAGIRPLLGCIFHVPDVELNILVSNNLPNWVKISDIEIRMKPFTTSDRLSCSKKDKGRPYPTVDEIVHADKTKKFYITFDPDTNHLNDASFARFIYRKFIFHNQENRNMFTEIKLEYKMKKQ